MNQVWLTPQKRRDSSCTVMNLAVPDSSTFELETCYYNDATYPRYVDIVVLYVCCITASFYIKSAVEYWIEENFGCGKLANQIRGSELCSQGK